MYQMSLYGIKFLKYEKKNDGIYRLVFEENSYRLWISTMTTNYLNTGVEPTSETPCRPTRNTSHQWTMSNIRIYIAIALQFCQSLSFLIPHTANLKSFPFLVQMCWYYCYRRNLLYHLRIFCLFGENENNRFISSLIHVRNKTEINEVYTSK
jgi:hypothetical protein